MTSNQTHVLNQIENHPGNIMVFTRPSDRVAARELSRKGILMTYKLKKEKLTGYYLPNPSLCRPKQSLKEIKIKKVRLNRFK